MARKPSERQSAQPPGTASVAPLLEAREIVKYFGAITALRGVDFHLNHGEVLGVVGDNGAGKSTLMKILSGLYSPSAGQIVFEGRTVAFSTPRDARNIGIEMVYQDFALAGNLPIFENIYLGREPGRNLLGLNIVDHARARAISCSSDCERAVCMLAITTSNRASIASGITPVPMTTMSAGSSRPAVSIIRSETSPIRTGQLR
jgi:ABC-type sugar transport system ATPase subunit